MGVTREKIGVWIGIVNLLPLLIISPASGHSVWKQRNEPGYWTVCLYHCDEEILNEGQELANAGNDSSLNLTIGSPEGVGLESTRDVRHSFLSRAIAGLSKQTCLSPGVTNHPLGDLSLEFWLKFAEYGADVQFGFLDGISMRVRIGGERDLFQLQGADSSIADATRYSAPGFESFPPVGSWHHIGVTIHAPTVFRTSNGRYRYQEDCYAQFYYDSHIVGYVNQTRLNLDGLEFAPQSKIGLIVHYGVPIIDEMMISNVDWSDPVGHGGTGHGGVRVGHAFEDGRQPAAAVCEWSLF